MNQTEKLLQNIIENARMGRDACRTLLHKTEDENMRRELQTQIDQYQYAVDDAQRLLQNAGGQPQPKGPMARAGMWMGMQMNTMMDRSTPHIAEILIQGATMGVVEITKARNAYADADAQAQGIASNMITRQQDAIERLKSFLNEKAVVK